MKETDSDITAREYLHGTLQELNSKHFTVPFVPSLSPSSTACSMAHGNSPPLCPEWAAHVGEQGQGEESHASRWASWWAFTYFYAESFLKYPLSQWKRNLPTLLLKQIRQNVGDKSSRQVRSKNLFSYYIRGDLLEGEQGGLLYSQTAQEYIFHTSDWAEAIALCHPHFNTTAISISLPLHVSVLRYSSRPVQTLILCSLLCCAQHYPNPSSSPLPQLTGPRISLSSHNPPCLPVLLLSDCKAHSFPNILFIQLIIPVERQWR